MNCRSIQKALEHFDNIAAAVVGACEGLPIEEEVRTRFEQFQDLAEKEFVLLKMIKSQDKLDPDEFEDVLLDFVLSWRKTLPDVDVFNKLHFIFEHYPDFVRRYQMCGRKSAESHESVHTFISRIKDMVKRMTSSEKMCSTVYARALANLKSGMAESREKDANRAPGKSGKERGHYNVSKQSSRQDESEFMAAVFGETKDVEGEDEQFIDLAEGGRIRLKHKKVYLYVKTGRAPDEWVRGLVKLNLLSNVKIEQSKLALH